MAYLSINDPDFDTTITLRDAYRIMEGFASEYLSRGDTPISDFLHAYAGAMSDGQTADPAAASDFLAVAERVRAE